MRIERTQPVVGVRDARRSRWWWLVSPVGPSPQTGGVPGLSIHGQRDRLIALASPETNRNLYEQDASADRLKDRPDRHWQATKALVDSTPAGAFVHP